MHQYKVFEEPLEVTAALLKENVGWISDTLKEALRKMSLTYLRRIRRHDALHSERTSWYRVSIIADVHSVRPLLRGNVLHCVHLIGRARLQFAGDWPTWRWGDLDIQFSLTSSSLSTDHELLVLPDVHLFDWHTRADKSGSSGFYICTTFCYKVMKSSSVLFTLFSLD